MTDRERLIELIREGNGGNDFMSLERIADHLLANGVEFKDNRPGAMEIFEIWKYLRGVQ